MAQILLNKNSTLDMLANKGNTTNNTKNQIVSEGKQQIAQSWKLQKMKPMKLHEA